MIIAQQDVPPRHRFRMTSGLASAPIDNARALCCAAEDIGTGVHRVPEDLQHRMIGRRPPIDFARAAVIASAELWKMGQMKAGDSVRFRRVTEEQARALESETERVIK